MMREYTPPVSTFRDSSIGKTSKGRRQEQIPTLLSTVAFSPKSVFHSAHDYMDSAAHFKIKTSQVLHYQVNRAFDLPQPTHP